MKNLIVDMQRCSIHDGPGVRMTVFLKGCPLKCKWCHNPESQKFCKQLSFQSSKCNACKYCSSVCSNGVHNFENQNHIINYDNCKLCGRCVENCLENSLKIIGDELSIQEILKIACKDMDFYKQSNGGVTISGGEPLSHSDFVRELLKELKNKDIHTCVETSGYGSIDSVSKILEYTDLFYFDWKISNVLEAKKYIGVSIEPIQKCLDYVAKNHKNIFLRCPIIPTVNDNTYHFDSIIELLSKYENIKGAELLPYHNFGISKSKNIGLETDEYNVPDKNHKDKWIEYFNNQGVYCIS